MIGPLFWALTLLGCAYAAVEGKDEGRWASALILCASALTIPATRLGARWMTTEWSLLAVDGGLLLGLYGLVIGGRRFFPIWMAGFQLVAVSTHLATLIAPRFTPNVYRAVESLWAIPITLSMILGVALDRRSERRE